MTSITNVGSESEWRGILDKNTIVIADCKDPPQLTMPPAWHATVADAE
jgi:hypothetical protein